MRATACRWCRIPHAFTASTRAATRSEANKKRQDNRKTAMYLEKFKLNGKTAFITGGGQGIGLACAEALAEAGARVIIGDRDSKVADSAKAGLKAKGFDVETAVMDVTDTGRV